MNTSNRSQPSAACQTESVRPMVPCLATVLRSPRNLSTHTESRLRTHSACTHTCTHILAWQDIKHTKTDRCTHTYTNCSSPYFLAASVFPEKGAINSSLQHTHTHAEYRVQSTECRVGESPSCWLQLLFWYFGMQASLTENYGIKPVLKWQYTPGLEINSKIYQPLSENL